MPELPETETIARDLHAAIAGRGILSSAVIRADVLRAVDAAGFVDAVRDQRLTRVWRRAKSIILDLSSEWRLAVTPRFTGALLIDGPDATDDYACLRLRLDDGRELRYSDVRRLGTVAALRPTAFATWEASLGPEPLAADFSPQALRERLRVSGRAIKTTLMDPKRVAGVGNIYANEALWRAGIKPARRANTLTVAQTDALHRELVACLTESVAARGTSFRDYRDAFGQRGSYAAQLKAYGRGDEPCLRCGAQLRETRTIDGRATVWCAECQR